MSNNIPQFTIRQMLESGVHYGHKKNRWNPQMSQFIYGSKGGVHIIDLTKTYTLLQKALQVISNTVKNNGKILFVGTKKQLANTIANYAKECNQYYVNYRWLGGMLTNWVTVSNSIKTLQNIEDTLSDKESKTTKKEKLYLSRKHEKLNKSLGGIRTLKGMPSLVIIFDTIKESNAVQEAQKLGIPIIAIVDTNSALNNITYPIPGNDDSAKSAAFFCDLMSKTINNYKTTPATKVIMEENKEKVEQTTIASEKDQKEDTESKTETKVSTAKDNKTTDTKTKKTSNKTKEATTKTPAKKSSSKPATKKTTSTKEKSSKNASSSTTKKTTAKKTATKSDDTKKT